MVGLCIWRAAAGPSPSCAWLPLVRYGRSAPRTTIDASMRRPGRLNATLRGRAGCVRACATAALGCAVGVTVPWWSAIQEPGQGSAGGTPAPAPTGGEGGEEGGGKLISHHHHRQRRGSRRVFSCTRAGKRGRGAGTRHGRRPQRPGIGSGSVNGAGCRRGRGRGERGGGALWLGPPPNCVRDWCAQLRQAWCRARGR